MIATLKLHNVNLDTPLLFKLLFEIEELKKILNVTHSELYSFLMLRDHSVKKKKEMPIHNKYKLCTQNKLRAGLIHLKLETIHGFPCCLPMNLTIFPTAIYFVSFTEKKLVKPSEIR